jgi:phosphoribosylglycinamide formyltransferase 2
LAEPDVDIRLFGKPTAHPYRRMGVALAKAENVEAAREKATIAASKVQIINQ